MSLEGIEIVTGYPLQSFNKSKGIYRESFEMKSDEWYARRLMGIGGSDIGKLLGYNDYEGGSALEMWMEKIGLKPQWKDGNKYTHYGVLMEDLVADQWAYYDGNQGSEVTNYRDGKIIRNSRRVNAFLTNEKYVCSDGLPFLYVNVDRLINQGCFNLMDGQLLKDNCPLEIKTASSWVAKRWKNGVSPMYIAQVYLQMMIMEVDYAEIAILELDRRELKVFPVIRNEDMVNRIEDNGYNFWEKMVKPAKILAREQEFAIQQGRMVEARKIEAELQRIEPTADSSEAYKDYMNKRFNAIPEKLMGQEREAEIVIQLNFLKEFIKELSPMVILRENQIRSILQEYEVLDFESFGLGKVTWKYDKNDVRSLRTDGFYYDVHEWVQQQIEIIDLPTLSK